MIASEDISRRITRSAFGHLLRRLRITADLSQEELAERAGVSARAISDLERGTIHRPRRDTVQFLADGLRLEGSERNAFVAMARGRSVRPSAEDSINVRPREHPFPLPPTSIIGRVDETTAAATLLHKPGLRLLTMTGPGGVGKTRLAIEVASKAHTAFPDGIYFVDLAPVRDSSLLLFAVARVLGVRASSDQPLAERLLAWLDRKRLLLLLDNCEHLAAAAADIADLLARSEGMTILATSRSPLHIRAEQEYRVEPLAVPDLDLLPAIGDLARIPAVDLFLDRAGAASRYFSLTPENARAVAEITVRLDGLPLAIELAAARIRVLPPAALLARLERQLPMLTGGARDLPSRQQALRSTLNWSFDLLSLNEQRLFRRLAVFVGGCTLDAAEIVAGDPDADALEVCDGLSTLVDQSLLRPRNASGEATRFSLLETVREYGLERLAAAGEAADICRRHATWCLALACQAERMLTGPNQHEWCARLDAEHDNLRAALTWSLERHDAETAQRLGGALWRYWQFRGLYGEGRMWLERALAMDADVVPLIRATACRGAARLAWRQGDCDRAETLNMEALGIDRAHGDRAGIAASLGGLGLVAHDRQQFERAAALYEEALALYQSLNDRPGIGRTLNSLGAWACNRGDYQRSAALHADALTIRRELGDQDGTAYTLCNLAYIAYTQGEIGQATELFGEGMMLFRQVGNKARLTESLEEFALMADARREPVRAVQLLGAAQALRTQIGVPLSPTAVHNGDLARVIAAARGCLGNDAFGAAWAEGQTMTLEQAIMYALGPDEV